jgi:hypothetical protein
VLFDPLEVGFKGLSGGHLASSQPACQRPCRQFAWSIGHDLAGYTAASS